MDSFNVTDQSAVVCSKGVCFKMNGYGNRPSFRIACNQTRKWTLHERMSTHIWFEEIILEHLKMMLPDKSRDDECYVLPNCISRTISKQSLETILSSFNDSQVVYKGEEHHASCSRVELKLIGYLHFQVVFLNLEQNSLFSSLSFLFTLIDLSFELICRIEKIFLDNCEAQ